MLDTRCKQIKQKNMLDMISQDLDSDECPARLDIQKCVFSTTWSTFSFTLKASDASPTEVPTQSFSISASSTKFGVKFCWSSSSSLMVQTLLPGVCLNRQTLPSVTCTTSMMSATAQSWLQQWSEDVSRPPSLKRFFPKQWQDWRVGIVSGRGRSNVSGKKIQRIAQTMPTMPNTMNGSGLDRVPCKTRWCQLVNLYIHFHGFFTHNQCKNN